MLSPPTDEIIESRSATVPARLPGRSAASRGAHRHWGGEEILVLSGTFVDKHGKHATGTWLQGPPLCEHDAFVEEETVILFKTG
jgi:anti-sigma factor ChrR (cupin superfamily)